ncbi:hypothetical protein BDB00DRAFT_185057 [Zychaea mexicana]|uniref:uncharacterized protein n=1 Tax=Zychaea mexicana TaxID=64656 RepID=UPI0022FED594|nr:uncharacterized protein BDB00DRAFT_185057 [Zychaea mexicana]KAI9479494.1 hypothetical protein BDB00DRAFT_185057 [Zychaea mexicana]
MQSAETGVFWEYKLENKNRQKAEIQEDYDSIAENSPYVSRSEDFLFYIANRNRIRLRMRRFSSGFTHREIRSLLFSSRQRKRDLVKDELLGDTPPHPAGEPIKWIHKSSHRSRKKSCPLEARTRALAPKSTTNDCVLWLQQNAAFPGMGPDPPFGTY